MNLMDVPLDDLMIAIVWQFEFHFERSLLVLYPVETCKASTNQFIELCYSKRNLQYHTRFYESCETQTYFWTTNKMENLIIRKIKNRAFNANIWGVLVLSYACISYHSTCMIQDNVILEFTFATKKWNFTRNLKIICFALFWNELFLIR